MEPAPNAPRACTPSARGADCRCDCGGLVARIVEAGVELRCRRCKRTLLVPWSAGEGWVRPAPGRRASVPVERPCA